MNNYLALTIGPIYETFNQARETRTVWAASYFFSWFIKQVLKKSKEKGCHVLLPYSEEIALSKWGSGLYADRIYFVVDVNGTKENIQQISKDIINELAKDIFSKIEKRPSSVNEIIDFLNNYLNIHIVEVDTGKPVLKSINGILDHQELKQNFPFRYNQNFLLDYLNLRVAKGSLLAKDAFGDLNLNKRRFRSIPEISTTSLERKHKENYRQIVNQTFKKEIDIFDELQNNNDIKKDFRQYQKYYTVIYADGDNIGQLLESTNDEEKTLHEFSKQLLAFGKLAEEKIVEYGGNGIYLGGEDILAFAPMACISKDNSELETIFSLIDKLDNCFEDTVVEFARNMEVTPLPTLSYGIMLSYVKHPLKESMVMAHNLMGKAKNKDIFPHKNTIGLRFQKHSGQYIECYIEKSKETSKKLIYDFVAHYCLNPLKDSQENLLSGVIQRFKDDMFFTTLYLAGKEGRLEAFFQNFFDEKIHKKSEKSQFLEDVRKLCESVFTDYSDKEASRNILFAIMRIVHFINQNKD